MTALDIGVVAKRSGVPPSTLRYYEQRGLIESVGRHGLRRQFDEHTVDQLALIALGQAAGFSLAEIADMFGPNGEPQLDVDVLLAKADDLDATIRRLTAMRDGLRHAAACPASSHSDCPSFQRLLRSAASGALERLTTGRSNRKHETSAQQDDR